jgi:hypothetical protein
MRTVVSILVLSVFGLVSSCGLSDDENDDDGSMPGGSTGFAGRPGTSGSGSGATAGAATGTVPCLAVPMTGNYCPRPGVCIGNTNCTCVNNVVQCAGGQQQQQQQQQQGTGGRGQQQQQGQGGATPNADCGNNPDPGDDCNGAGVCAGEASCSCTNGEVSCTQQQQQGNAGRGQGSAGRGQGGTTTGGSGGTGGNAGANTEGGQPDPAGGASTEGGTDGEGGASPGAGSGGTGAGVTCPQVPNPGDLCAGVGECPNTPGCFCQGTAVVGSTCGA